MKEFEPRTENKEVDIEPGLEKLESPPKGDFIAGLRNFIAWAQDLVARK